MGILFIIMGMGWIKYLILKTNAPEFLSDFAEFIIKQPQTIFQAMV